MKQFNSARKAEGHIITLKRVETRLSTVQLVLFCQISSVFDSYFNSWLGLKGKPAIVRSIDHTYIIFEDREKENGWKDVLSPMKYICFKIPKTFVSRDH